ncbi:uncharacterized protein PHALS_14562 [Plasmopara halstedii]|uniref:Uncharacterized protein n=1 Tax=Plasmopara halstedii TaxID=4781 RepID=A0A0P1ALB8_PLAHL|nr:uncharacterized protein PHALS_14562 [Plasmopara halstedii]CEG41781.1 hypothetical protein PHALS_14562 [Plasmopara halstedii]|eukprot:XP_024578150.1 hypothetical protein PHALS_14562 [Plasmopara halstedii]
MDGMTAAAHFGRRVLTARSTSDARCLQSICTIAVHRACLADYKKLTQGVRLLEEFYVKLARCAIKGNLKTSRHLILEAKMFDHRACLQ